MDDFDLTSDEYEERDNSDACNLESSSDPDLELFKELNIEESKEHIEHKQFPDNGSGSGQSPDHGEIDAEASSVITIEGPLPRPRTPRTVTFGRRVENARRDILHKRQMCKTKEEFDFLYCQIDNWIDHANEIGQNTIAIRLLLDKSVVAHFGLDFEKALELSELALDKTNELESYDEAFQLQLVGKFVQCSVHSRNGKYGRAWGMLQDIASQIKGSENSVDHWRLHYNMGTNLLARLKACSVKDDRLCLAGVEHFKKCRESICDGEARGQTYDIQDHFFALVMSAKLFLDLPEHTTKREHSGVTTEHIMNAQDLLQMICTDYPAITMVHRFKLRLFITFAGLFYRRGQRNSKEEDDNSARRDFIDAMVFLECASMLGKDSPYEEHEIIHEFLAYLRKKAESIFLRSYSKVMAGVYGLDQYKDRESEHELDDPQSEGFTSDDFGNPGQQSNKTRKRRTRKVRHAQSTNNHFSNSQLTSSTSISTVSTDPNVKTSKPLRTLEEDTLIRIQIEDRQHNPTSSSVSSGSASLSGSLGSSSSSASNFQTHRDTPSDPQLTFEAPEPVQYRMSSSTDSSPEQWTNSTDSEAEDINMHTTYKVSGYLQPKRDVKQNYYYLAKQSLPQSVYGVKKLHEDFSSSRNRRDGIMFELSHVQQYITTARSWNCSRENFCIPLLVSAKVALDFPDSSIGMRRFVVSMSDLKVAHQAILAIKQILPVYPSPTLMVEIPLIVASFYFRASQIAAKYKLVSTCKLSLNMALMYAEFAEVFALGSNVTTKIKSTSMFKKFLEEKSRLYIDKLDTSVLLHV